MTHDQISELLGAYALDAVDPEERDLVEAHLLSCARCRAEVADHREVASLLAHSGSDAPEGLWDRIAGTLEEAPPALQLPPIAELAPRREAAVRTGATTAAGRSRWLPNRANLLVAAAAALVIAFLGVQVRNQDQRIDELQTALRDPMTPAFQEALDDPDSHLFELASQDGRTVVRGAVAADGTGYIRMVPLPELPDNRTYQLWGDTGGQLVSLGVVGDRPTIYCFKAGGYSAFAITEEVAPGVVQSRNEPVVAGSVTA